MREEAQRILLLDQSRVAFWYTALEEPMGTFIYVGLDDLCSIVNGADQAA